MNPEKLLKYNEKPLDSTKHFLKKGHIKSCKLLEINCGSATDSLYLSGKRFKITGIDNSATLINFAKHKDKSNKCKFVVSEILPLPFTSRTFDMVLDKSYFANLDKKYYEDYTQEVYRVLGVKGKFIITILSKEEPKLLGLVGKNKFLTSKDISKTFGKHFKILETHEKEIDEEFVLKSFLMEKK